MDELQKICSLFYPKLIFAIDGIAANRKTSIINRLVGICREKAMTGESDFVGIDLMNLIAEHLLLIVNRTEPTVYDRNITHPLEWSIVWSTIDKLELVNRKWTSQDERLVLKQLKEKFLLLRQEPVYCYLNNILFTLVLLSNDFSFISNNMKKRNNNSDRVRSSVKLYFRLQTLMYKTLYPNQWINTKQLYNSDESFEKSIQLINGLCEKRVRALQPYNYIQYVSNKRSCE